MTSRSLFRSGYITMMLLDFFFRCAAQTDERLTTKKKALNYYIPWCSLHGAKITKAGSRRDFFLVDVSCNCPLSTMKGRSLLPMKHLTFLLLILLLFTVGSLHAQWVKASGPLDGYMVLSFTELDSSLFVGTNGAGVFKTTNEGQSWQNENSGLSSMVVNALVTLGPQVFVATNSGVFLSTDGGDNWIRSDSGLGNAPVWTFAKSDSNLLAGTIHNGVFLSTDDGEQWTREDSGLADSVVLSLVSNRTDLFAGTRSGVFNSEDSARFWMPSNQGLGGVIINALAICGTRLLAGTGDRGVFVSTDNGVNWRPVNSGLTDTVVTTLAVFDTDIFAGTLAGGIYETSDYGNSWREIDSGLTDRYIYSLCATSRYLFAGTDSGVWRRPLSEVTPVRTLPIGRPINFALSQNYPNPFNPSTTITYRLPQNSFVTLKLYDILGQEVRTLVEREENSGVHSVRFDARGLSSGVYLYVLHAGTFSEMKKLAVIK